MRRLATTILCLLITFLSFAAPINTASIDGSWSNPAAWSLNRAPQTADTIVIAAGRNVTVDNFVTYGDVFLKVYGTLTITGRLEISNNSVIMVYNTGKVQGTGNNGDRIRIGINYIFKGDDAPVLGPVMANGNTTSFITVSQAPLPVKFVGFSASRKNNDVLVQWATSEESFAAAFEVQRSLDGNNWTVAATVAAAGNTRNLTNYSYTDRQVTAKQVYYRIRQVDVDGRAVYTAIKTVKADAAGEISVGASAGRVVLQFAQEVKSGVSVRIVRLNGQVVSEQKVANAVGQVILNTAVKGAYVVSISNGAELNMAKQVLL